MTIEEALTKGKRRLKTPCQNAFIDTPLLDAALLLSEALQKSREELIIHGGEPISDADMKKFSNLLERRRAGECIAYILGRKEFRGLNFTVNPHVLVPRPDTEILLEAALEHIDAMTVQKYKDISVLDLCTGSGALAISLKNERPFVNVTASDISSEALDVAALNAQKLLDTGSSSQNLQFINSDLFQKITEKYNIIMSNPPYVLSKEITSLPPEIQKEPSLALDGGKDGLNLIHKIISLSPDHLQPDGVLLLEASPKQMSAIKTLLKNHGFICAGILKDLAGRERVISARMLLSNNQ